MIRTRKSQSFGQSRRAMATCAFSPLTRISDNSGFSAGTESVNAL
jgi:hypothetical protein